MVTVDGLSNSLFPDNLVPHPTSHREIGRLPPATGSLAGVFAFAHTWLDQGEVADTVGMKINVKEL